MASQREDASWGHRADPGDDLSPGGATGGDAGGDGGRRTSDDAGDHADGDGYDGPLVGRADTLAEVTTDLCHVGPGGTAAVFVTGESGVGKSRLLRETARAMTCGAVAVLFGVCLDIGDASPLHPVLRALRQSDQVPSPGDDDAGALLERVSRELRAVASGRHLLLVLDDLQWADRSTRQLLLYLLAGLGDMRLSVLAAVRAEALHGAHPLRRVLAELRRLRSVKVVELAPLDRGQTLDLLDAITGETVEPEDAERVYWPGTCARAGPNCPTHSVRSS